MRVGVVGCGAQGGNHLDAYAGLPEVEVVALCDRDPVRLAAARRRFPDAAAFPGHRELLADAAVDLVSVCTMPASHRDVAADALAAGAHVLCEKPPARSLAEVDDMLAAAERAGRTLTFGFNMRFLPAARFLRRLVAGGGLGRPRYTRAWTVATDIPWWGPHYVRGVSGGGVLASTAVHILDLAMWVAGGPTPVTVSASMATVFPRKRAGTAPSPEAAGRYDVEDLAAAHVRFADGSWMTLHAGWAWDAAGPSYSFELVGDAATVELDPLRVTAERDGRPVDVTEHSLRRAGVRPGAALSGPGLSAWRRSVTDGVADVVGALLRDRPPCVTAEQARTVQALLDCLYRSARSGREVTL